MSFFPVFLHALTLPVPCTHCGRDIPGDEMENISRDQDGDPICDECYYDQYHFRCSLCGEHEHNRHQHNVMVVYEDGVIGGQKPGLFQIIDLPYYMDGMIEGYVIESAVKRVGPLPKGAQSDGYYPAGHLCRQCVKKHVPRCSKPKVHPHWHANG